MPSLPFCEDQDNINYSLKEFLRSIVLHTIRIRIRIVLFPASEFRNRFDVRLRLCFSTRLFGNHILKYRSYFLRVSFCAVLYCTSVAVEKEVRVMIDYLFFFERILNHACLKIGKARSISFLRCHRGAGAKFTDFFFAPKLSTCTLSRQILVVVHGSSPLVECRNTFHTAPNNILSTCT